MYQYRAEVIRVVDGDTLHLDVDLGFDVKRKDSFRLYGINAPEKNTPEGMAAKEWLEAILTDGPTFRTITITTHKDQREKYGRYLATLWIGERNINETMIDQGFAVPYSGGAR